jgi:predicted TPR repeat methyltransferase
MGARNKRVLELGCSEGIGASILSEFSTSYTGVDLDHDAIEVGKRIGKNLLYLLNVLIL